ncbi:MAG TPA: 2-oxoglutarate dehydrogenase E1 component, partial [Longimicrobiales bacterium]|nr:2-oxoglutarate dehydrogenase E1 component [Longimicrobiales bacterium]
ARREIDSEETGEHSFVLHPNPSHLELVNPVALGMVRAYRDLDRADADSALAILVHGDSAFPGQGVVAESLNLAQLPAYGVGGTIHIIANNQLGFTAESHESFSGRYSSDPARGLDIPIVHVNADDVEACIAAGRLAFAYRKTFGKDFLIDLVGYRRYGHNEGDEPSFTQPQMYQAIEAHPSTRALWAERLSSEGLISRNQAEVVVGEVRTHLRSALDEAWKSDDKHRRALWFGESGSALSNATGLKPATRDALIRWNKALHAHPESFHLNPKLQRAFQRRASALDKGGRIDWPHAESLAFASILQHGISVRLVGQDTERGTFSQRHAVLHDVETGERHIPLAALGKDGASFVIANSPLSEQAALGFEYGYSIAAPRHLVLWEAQFGDFVNVAQVMIDQFLAAGLAKWGQYSRLTLLLPHGYEGQGPEHSSARLERFLQLCAEQNMRVTYPTTPAQYFHLLRRQALRRPERPMVVMTPKSLLRHPMATSTVAELMEGGFLHVLADPTVQDPSTVERLVLCTGKVYYDLQGHGRRGEASSTAVARMELLYPFPDEALTELLGRYPNLKEVIWAQEEPRNMGALTFVGPRLRAVVPRKVPLAHVARPDRASPAEGKAKDHARQQEALVLEALGLASPS